MDKILEILTSEFSKGNWNVIILVITIVMIFKFTELENFLDRRLGGKVKSLRDYLSVPELDVTNKEFLIEEINRHIFWKISKISADRKYRDIIKKIVSDSDGTISYHSISKISKYLEMKDGKILIKFNNWAKFDNLFNYFMFSLMSFFFILILSIPLSSPELNFQQASSIVVVEFLILSFAIFLLFQTIPMRIAKKIMVKLEQIQTVTP